MNAPMDPALGTAGALIDNITPTGFYLANFNHKSPGAVQWWGPDHWGYTTDLEQAGIYSYEDAKRLNGGDAAVPVPVEMVDDMRVRRVVDPSDGENIAFGCARFLRAHLAITGRWIDPIIEPAPPVDHRARLAGLLYELHRDGLLSEQQCASRFGTDLVTWRGIREAEAAKDPGDVA